MQDNPKTTPTTTTATDASVTTSYSATTPSTSKTTPTTTTTFASTTTTTMNTVYGIIVTGGSKQSNKSVEILKEDLDGNVMSYCSLPDLPDVRNSHTQSAMTTCGGGETNDTKTSCVTFSSGLWKPTHVLQYERQGHSSWMSTHGIVILGGAGPFENSTEILKDDGTSALNFTINDIDIPRQLLNTEFHILNNLFKYLNIFDFFVTLNFSLSVRKDAKLPKER